MMINAYAANGDQSGAEKWLDVIRLKGLAPNQVTYASLCKGLSRHPDNVEAIQRIIDHCDANGIEVNEYFFAPLITACGECNPPQIRKAEAAYKELIRRGISASCVKKAFTKVVGKERSTHFVSDGEVWQPGSNVRNCKKNGRADFVKGHEKAVTNPRLGRQQRTKCSNYQGCNLKGGEMSVVMPEVEEVPLPSLLSHNRSRKSRC